MNKKSIFAVFVLVVVVSLVVGCAGGASQKTVQPIEGTLQSVSVKTAPVIDGNSNDSVWSNAPVSAISVRTFGTPAFNIKLKSVYDANNVYFLVQYPDTNYDVDRGTWAFNADKNAWERIADDFGDEDEFGFFWNISIADYAKTGCLATCHTDSVGTFMASPKDQLTDDWRWNTVRTNPLGWARDFHLTSDRDADGVGGAGGFSKDDGYTKATRGYTVNTQELGNVDVPLYWKPFSGTGGVIVGDPRYLLQSEIDSGLAKKIVKVETDGTLVDDSGNKVPMFARIPGWILSRPPESSWTDIKAKGIWMNGVWTVEFARKLNTGHTYDVQFEVGKSSYFDMYIKTRQPGESAHAQVPTTKFVFVK